MCDKPFETVDHTADLALVVQGRTLSDLFRHAAEGLMAQLVHPDVPRRRRTRRRWTLTAPTVEDLLVAWLRELLFAQDVEGLAFMDFTVAVTDETNLTAAATAADRLPDEPLTDIKAVTYHDLEVVRVDDRFQVKLVFDL